MAVVVKMPQLGESTIEGTVVRWLKAPGDSVAKFEPLLEISTDKIDTEVPSPTAGILLEIVAAAGKTLRVGSTLAHIGAADERIVDLAQTPATTPVATKPSGRDFISPVVARMAAEYQVDPNQMSGSGGGGRVTKKDVLAYLDQRRATNDQRQEPMPAVSIQVAPTQDEILVPLTAMRRAIAYHMVQSKQTSPHVTTIFEVDMTAVVQHREAHKPAFAEKGIHLTYTPYFVAATATALRQAPALNSRFTPDGILHNRHIHIGVAVALEQGLIVPVIHNADEKNLQGLARAVNELAAAARSGKLAPDATQGGTFTITNHGVGGSLIGTPIINQPQAGILGIGAIVKRPVVRTGSPSLLPSADDALVIRPMCYLSLSFDHRLLDGARADQFLTIIKQTLENWASE
ncbi:MAG: 2-oxo acid dehydrogenase subunit E2 [Chloroflexota bacterium]|nr:2-oxo acid dehydrogenase subunit E2 [Chloroflexota bacterium]